MGLYSLSKTLPSCQVKRVVLEDLEKYIKDKVVEVANENEAVAYFLKIKDSIGTENVGSIKDYDRPYFPDDTEGITMSCHIIGNSNKLSIDLKFNITEMSSKIDVTSNVGAARDNAMNVAEEILRRLQNYKTHNYLFDEYSPYAFIAFLFMFLGVTGLLSSLLPSNPYKGIIGSISGTIFLVGIGWFALKSSKPYSTFETRLNERREKRANIIIGLIISFIFITIIGTYLRIKFLGF